MKTAILRYGAALAITAAITLLRRGLDRYLENSSVYSFYYAALIISAWYLGFGPSILTIACGAVIASYYFAPPRGSFQVHEARHIGGLTAFVVVGGYMAYLIHWLKRDIARREKAEAELVASQEQVETHQAELAHMARLTLMGEMSASLAHELNQPLHSSRNYAQGSIRRMQRDPDSDPEVMAALQRISEESDRAANILRRVRDFVNKNAPLLTSINLDELLHDAMLIVNLGSKTKRAQVVFDLPSDLPPVRGDRVEIEQVIVNLGRNALEAMADLPEQARLLRIGARRAGEQRVEVYIHDCGAGIPAENMPRVFEAFFSTKADGMGMGLAISRSIIERHEGRLWVTSNEDRGCTFHFTLPYKEI